MLQIHTFENQPVCLKMTSKSENELFSMDFEGKCAIELVHGLSKTGGIMQRVIQGQQIVVSGCNINLQCQQNKNMK